MHLYFISRGIKQNRDIFVNFLQTRLFPWKIKIDGKETTETVQGALRPVELWEYVFPKESLPEVCGMLGIDPKNTDNYGALSSSIQNSMLRKMLGAKEIPKDITPIQKDFVFKQGMGLHVLGIKDDVMGKIGNRDQEML